MQQRDAKENSAEARRAAGLKLREMAMDLSHPDQSQDQWNALKILWNSGDNFQEKDRVALLPTLLQMARSAKNRLPAIFAL